MTFRARFDLYDGIVLADLGGQVACSDVKQTT